MYNFIDVNEASENTVLPSEALKINGEYIENQIEGYRTLNVSGREALSPDVYSYETGIRDGTKLRYKRYPERIIIIKYQIKTESNEAFREAYNQLGRILNVEDAKLIFNDEQDKFYTGTPCIIGGVEPGKNSVVGEFEILCTDPFKYSIKEYEAVPEVDDRKIIRVDYNGTYRAFPVLETDFYSEKEVADDGETPGTLTGNGDCGYVAFFNENGKIIQLGDPDEVDGNEEYDMSQTLVNQTFFSDTAWGTTAKSLWIVNAGDSLPVDISQAGILNMKSIPDVAGESASQYYIGATSYGTGSAWHGPSIKRVIPADAAGDMGASNFTFSFKIRLSIGENVTDTEQIGGFHAHLLADDGTDVAGIRIVKTTAGKTAKLMIFVNNENVHQADIDITYDNTYFGKTGVKDSLIRKFGNRITFSLGGYRYAFTDDAVSELKAAKIMFLFEQYAAKKPLSYNGLVKTKFIKNMCNTFNDTPNKFSANDIVEADCETGEILLNGISSPELGALGNDWEEFYLTPGENQIGFAYSDWIEDENAPSWKVRYREVFL